MNRADFAQAVERLGGLAELYGVKPPTQKAIEFWWEGLRGHTLGDALAAIDSWARSRPKMPMPSDIVAMASERLSDRIENQAAADKAQEKREIANLLRTQHGRRVLEAMRKVLDSPLRRDYTRCHRQAIDRFVGGDATAVGGFHFAREALRLTAEEATAWSQSGWANWTFRNAPVVAPSMPGSREPGQDDEEIAACTSPAPSNASTPRS